jgi:hypothetical protein
MWKKGNTIQKITPFIPPLIKHSKKYALVHIVGTKIMTHEKKTIIVGKNIKEIKKIQDISSIDVSSEVPTNFLLLSFGGLFHVKKKIIMDFQVHLV